MQTEMIRDRMGMMKVEQQVFRIRERRRSTKAPLTRVARMSLVAGSTILIALSLTVVLMGIEFAQLGMVYPPIGRIETYMGTPGSGVFLPPRFFDSTGVHVLYEALHPNATERRWLNEENTPELLTEAVLAAQPEAFHRSGLVEYLLNYGDGDVSSIPEQVIRGSLLRSSSLEGSHWMTPLMVYRLMGELQMTYSEEQILEWYLNTVYLGNYCWGYDAASLVYFGKHAGDLSLGEIAFLAALPRNPEMNPVDSPVDALGLQQQVIDSLLKEERIAISDAQDVGLEPISVQKGVKEAVPVELSILWNELTTVLPEAAGRIGVRAVTSIDYEIHQQAIFQLGDLEPWNDTGNGTDTGFLVEGSLDDSPGESNKDTSSWMILDPREGSVLSFGGDVRQEHVLGSAVDPLLYLAAYAQGSSPSTMVLDIPYGQPEVHAEMDEYTGPVSMRFALKNGLNVRRDVLNRTGLEPVMMAAQQLGFEQLADDLQPLNLSELLRGEANLEDLSLLHAVLANSGTAAGRVPDDMETTVPTPVYIARVDDAEGLLYEQESYEQFIVSRQLAYLLVDSLRNTLPEGFELCCLTPFDGNTWAAHQGSDQEGRTSWMFGSTPYLTIGLWEGGSLGSLEPEFAGDMTMDLWNALANDVENMHPTGTWEQPPGMERLEICDPSGLLPTIDCARIVEDIFISGQAPRSYDTMYQSVEINRETGRLATVFTPIQLRETHVFLQVPEAAKAWADLNSIPQIPVEYDTSRAARGLEEVILEPSDYSVIHGDIDVVTEAIPVDVELLRLQYGEGLNPVQWHLLEEIEGSTSLEMARTEWNTGILSGLFVLQAVIVDGEGRMTTSTVPLILDNEKPTVELRLHAEGGGFITAAEEFVIEVLAEDNHAVQRVDLFIGNEKVEQWAHEPYQARLSMQPGVYQAYARVFDQAGNETTAETILIEVGSEQSGVDPQ